MDKTSECDSLSLHQQLQAEQEKVSKLKVLVIREKKGAASLKEQLESTLSDVEAWKTKCISLETRLQEVVDSIPAIRGAPCEKERQAVSSAANTIAQLDVEVQHCDNQTVEALEKIADLENELATITADRNVHLQTISHLESQLVELEAHKDRLRELERTMTRAPHEYSLGTSENVYCAPIATKSVDTNQCYDGVERPGQMIDIALKVVHPHLCTVDNCEDRCLKRMTTLENRVLKLKEFVEDQVERASAQAVEVMQKLKLQAADYDHLIRGKESEIFSLRESCDSLSEEVSLLSDFYCSLMRQYMTACSHPSQEIPSDWSILTSQTDIGESLESRFRLMQTLGGFQDHLLATLNNYAIKAPEVPQKVNAHWEIGVECTTMAEQVEQLNKKLIELESLLRNRENDREAMQQELVKLREDNQHGEEKIQRMKALLVKVKFELSENRTSGGRLETLTEENSSLRTAVDVLTAERDELREAGKRLEMECAVIRQQVLDFQEHGESIREERDLARSEISRLQSEFSAYKLKAFHALRGNTGGSAERHTSSVASSNHEVVGSATNRDDQSMGGSFAGMADMQKALQEELRAAHRRMEEVSLDASLARTECELVRQELTELRSRYSELNACMASQKQHWESKVADIARQRDAVVSSRIRELEKVVATQQADFHRRIMEERDRFEQRIREESLHKERTGQSIQLKEVQEKPESRQSTPRNGRSVSSFDSNTALDEPFCHLNRGLSLDRIRGDGADFESPESTDYERALRRLPQQSGSCSPNGTARPHGQDSRLPKLVSLEHLLRETDTTVAKGTTTPERSQSSTQSPVSAEGRSALVPQFPNQPGSSPIVQQQVNGLRTALANQQRRVEQLSELLNDSESTVARLIDQSTILKDEIRRLEQQQPNRSTSSDTAASDQDEQTRLQYVKDVLLRYVRTQQDSKERQCLSTVLSSLLKLDVHETELLAQIILASAAPKSWTSYLVGS